MSGHTPGRWQRCKHGGASDGSSIHVETDAPGEKGWFLEISAGYPFAKMADPVEAEREFIANCDLVLAAPAMLAALTGLISGFERGVAYAEYVTKAKAAIAAAEGTDND